MRFVLSDCMNVSKGYGVQLCSLTVCRVAVTGGAHGCRDQLQKHQEARRAEDRDGLHQSPGGEGRLRHCCKVGLPSAGGHAVSTSVKCLLQRSKRASLLHLNDSSVCLIQEVSKGSGKKHGTMGK